MADKIEKQIALLGIHLNSRLDTIDLTLRKKQIEDAGRFATIEGSVRENSEDNDRLGSKLRTHLGEHFKWIFYPVIAVTGILGLFKFLG